MRQRVRAHAEVILVDIGAWFAIASCRFSVANWFIRYNVQRALYFEKEGDLKFSGTAKRAKPTDSPALNNWLFVCFFNSVWLASTGRATPETHHQARLAQTDSGLEANGFG